MTRREHIEQLAEDMGATISYTAPRYGAAMNQMTGTLYLTPWCQVPEEEGYWFALHELGHLGRGREPGNAHHEQAGSYLDLDAEVEAEAWTWALDHAAFPFDQAGQSAAAWGLADRLHDDFYVGPELERMYRELGEEPDWFFNVTEPEHFAKLWGYAIPNWNELRMRIRESSAVESHRRAEA